LDWAVNIGGDSYDNGYSVACDTSGNVYSLGSFQDTVDFDPGSATVEITSQGETDIFLTKFDVLGNFLWVKTFGSADTEFGLSIALDNADNILITGYFETDLDFDPNAGVEILTSNGNNDAFVVKLDNNGNYLWANNFGSGARDTGIDLAIDPSGNILVIGYFNNTADFDPGPGTANLTSFGDEDIFIVKLSTNGDYIWAKQLGGNREDFPKAITVDAAGNIYSTGNYINSAPDFDPGPGIFLLESAGTIDKMFISKLDAGGNFVWAKQASGTHFNVGNDIAVSPSNDVLVTGYFYATQDFDPGPGIFELTANFSDTYVLKLDSSGNFIWVKQTGGDGFEEGISLKTDANGGIVVLGNFEDTVDFDPGAGNFPITSAGFSDIYVQYLQPSGNFGWVSTAGGVDVEQGNFLTIDGDQNIITTGIFYGTADFDPSNGVFSLSSEGENDAFILKLENAPLGIVENSSLGGMSVWPNPFSEALHIKADSEIENISVYDLLGRKVFETASISENTTLELGTLKNGVYLAAIVSKGKKATVKIVKN